MDVRAVHEHSHTYTQVTPGLPDGRHFLGMSDSHMCFHQRTCSYMLVCFGWKKMEKYS